MMFQQILDEFFLNIGKGKKLSRETNFVKMIGHGREEFGHLAIGKREKKLDHRAVLDVAVAKDEAPLFAEIADRSGPSA